MSQRVTIESIVPACDPRGVVVEPLSSELLPLQRNVHLVLTKPGHVRGNHYHERGTEVTLAFGPALFRYREGSELRDVPIAAGQTYRITILPGVAHAFQNTGPERLLLIGFDTEPHDPARPDVVREELIKPAAP